MEGRLIERGLTMENISMNPSQEQLAYLRKVASKRIESDLRSFKFQQMLDDFLQIEEVSELDNDLIVRYENYRNTIFPKDMKLSRSHWNDYQKMVYHLPFELFVRNIIMIKNKEKGLFSKNERDTLKIIYFIIKKDA